MKIIILSLLFLHHETIFAGKITIDEMLCKLFDSSESNPKLRETLEAILPMHIVLTDKYPDGTQKKIRALYTEYFYKNTTSLATESKVKALTQTHFLGHVEKLRAQNKLTPAQKQRIIDMFSIIQSKPKPQSSINPELTGQGPIGSKLADVADITIKNIRARDASE